MTVKLWQAVTSIFSLIKDPFDFPPAIKLCDAIAESWPIRPLYHRMVKGLTLEEQARLCELTRAPIDLAALRRLPPNTFGYQYANMFIRYSLSPTAQVDVCPTVAALFEREWIMLRYTRLHDMHHVLLDFGVDPHGEMGLQMFGLRNFHEPFGLLAMASLPRTAALYGDLGRMLREIIRGHRHAQEAKNLLCAPLEEYFERDMDELRAELGIVLPTNARRAGSPESAAS